MNTLDIVTEAGSLLLAVRERLRALGERNTRPFTETATEEFLSERDRAMAAMLERLEADTKTHAQLIELITDEFLFLQGNYQLEAAREARRERRRMLAYAAASAFGLAHSFGDKARIERTLRSLDAEDVLWLYSLQHGGSVPGPINRELAEDALVGTGCIQVPRIRKLAQLPDPFDRTNITTLGRLIANVLGDYVAVRRAEAAIPAVPKGEG